MFCSKCGKEIPDNSLFCTQCGNKVTPADDQIQKNRIPRPTKTAMPESMPKEEGFSRKEQYAYIAAGLAILIVIGIFSGLLIFNLSKKKLPKNEEKDRIVTSEVTEDIKIADTEENEPVMDEPVPEASLKEESKDADIAEALPAEPVYATEEQQDEEEPNNKTTEEDQADAILYEVEVTAPDGYVNFRTGPSTDYDIICPIPNGNTMPVFEEAADGRWLKVEYDGIGWVAASQVTKR